MALRAHVRVALRLGSILLVQQLSPGALAIAGEEAPAGFDGSTNGSVPQEVLDGDRSIFAETEKPEEGLGPVFNAESCAQCHTTPTIGGFSQVTELRVGHLNASGAFENPTIPIGGGESISGRSLVNDRATCTQIKPRVPPGEDIRTLRASISLLGDGFVEAVPDAALLEIARSQCEHQAETGICGQALLVRVLEAPGQSAVGRFGWKSQHASLLSFSADAYVNEMGITSDLQPTEFTPLCDGVADPEDIPKQPGEEVGGGGDAGGDSGGDGDSSAARRASAQFRPAIAIRSSDPNSPDAGGGEETPVDGDGEKDVPRFARFMRATQPPSRDETIARSAGSERGSQLFDDLGCATCHVRTLTTAPAGTLLHGGTFEVSPAVGDKDFHAFSDFLLHDVGTGDGIAMAPDDPASQETRNKIRTAPLWGLRFRSSRLMHDGGSPSPGSAIERHAGEAAQSVEKFRALTDPEKQDLMQFLSSL